MPILSQNTQFSTQSLYTCSLQYLLHLLHIIFKFSFLVWQVPRSSVGRALYRICGPSQDGNPVPGNLPFCFVLFFFFFLCYFFFNYFFEAWLLFPFNTSLKRSLEKSFFTLLLAILHQPRFSSSYWQVYLSKCTLKWRKYIETLLNLSINKSSNKVFY